MNRGLLVSTVSLALILSIAAGSAIPVAAPLNPIRPPIAAKPISIIPAAPSGLTAAVVGTIQVNLTWKDNAANETGFKIERREAGGQFVEIKTTAANTTSYSDQTVKFKTVYTYRVKAFNGLGSSAYSNEVQVTTPDPPPASPGSLTANVVSATQVDLRWKDNANNETGFKIERKAPGGQYAAIATVGANATAYSDKTVTATATYFYRVRACNAGGSSLPSNEVSVYIPGPPPTAPPAAPSNLTAATPLYYQVALSWQDNSNSEAGFKIERRTGSGQYAEIARTESNIATYLDQLQTVGTYYYRICAFNSAGESGRSNEVWATPGPPAAPTGLTATPISGTQIKLVWQIGQGKIDGYKITRAGEDMLFKVVATIGPGATTYLDNDAHPGELYRYFIQSYNGFGNSGLSNTVAAGLPPAAPSDLTATPLSPYTIGLTWKDNSDREKAYKIERSTNGGPFEVAATMMPNTTKYDDVLLTPNTTYTYRVKAVHYNLGDSGWSNEVTAKTPG